MVLFGDKSIGPQYNSESDFTLAFEHIVLTIIPVSLLLLCSPIILGRYLTYEQEPEDRGSGFLLALRLAPTGVLFVVEIISIGFWKAVPKDGFWPAPALAAAILSCVAALDIAAIVFIEYRRCLRTSAFLSIYLSISVILDAIKARTYFSRENLPGVGRIGALCVAGAVAKLALAVLEEVPKRSRLGGQHLRNSVGSESLSGFWNRSLFIWLNSTLFLGFRNVLDVGDLENLGPDMDAERLQSQFREAWGKTDKTSRFCLMKACLFAFWEPFLLIPIPRLFFIGFNFSQPVLLHRILVSIRQEENLPVDVQNGLIAATVLIFFGTGITNASFTHLSYRFIARLRSVLVQEIYYKTLAISQPEAEQNAAVTLMSTEIDVMILGLAQFHDVWAAFLEIGVGTWLLSTIVGHVCYLIIPAAIISTAMAYELGRRMGPARAAWNSYIQVRVAKTANVLSQVKALKMLGLSSTLADYLQAFRVQEIVYTKLFRRLTAIMVGSAMFMLAATPIVVVAGALFWTTFDRHLSADEVFPMMAILYFVEEPLSNILNYYPNIMSTMACIRRMQDYLLLDEIQGISPAETVRASRHTEAVEKSGSIEIGQRRLRAPLPTTDQHVVQFFRASIAPKRGKPAVLSGVNINIERYSLAMVTSRTAGGKTTLLRAIIGGAEIVQGSMNVDPRIGYCAQQPWIRNDTICKNVISEYMFDPVWYDAVIKACLLQEDIRNFPSGDQFITGTGGVNLSGGQKQRVAIARAVYSRSPVLVFDDVFASLDRSTAAGIFCALFGSKGLIKKTNATVIMATSTTADYLDLATDVLYIHSDGSVTTHTNDKRPNSSDAALFKLLAQAEPTEINEKTDIAPEIRNEENKSRIEEERDDLQHKANKGLYRFYLKSAGWARFLAFVALTVVMVFAERLPRIFIRLWINADPDNMRLFIPFALIGVLSGLLSGANLFYYWFYFVPESAQSLHKMLADVVMRAKLSFLTTTDSGTILNRFSQDMNLVTQELPLTFWKCVYFSLLLILDVCVLVSGVSYAAASLPFLIVALYIVQAYYLRTSRQLRCIDLEAKSPLYTHFTETAAGLEHIRCFGWHAKAIARNIELLEYSQKPFYHMYAIQRWLTLVLDMTVLALAAIVVALVLRLQGITTPAGLGLTFLNLISLGTGMTSFIERWTDMETSLGAIARLRSFLSTTPVEKGRNDGEQVPENWPQHGHIEMNHVTASYQEGDVPAVLRNVSLSFRPGKKAAIIGRSGSGKSTIITTILNFLDYTGSIQIDGIELSRIAPDTLRSRITTITQDRISLDGTARDNLLPEEILLPLEQRTETSIILQALREVGLSDKFTGGLDIPLADVGLSAGQHQQFSIARAIIHHQRSNSRIVLMDEPTSSMGYDEDCAMQAVMARVFSECTVVAVTHRLETMQNTQIVVELENGVVAGYTD